MSKETVLKTYTIKKELMKKLITGVSACCVFALLSGCGGNTRVSGLAQFYELNDRGAGSTGHVLDVANDGTAVGYIRQGLINKPSQWLNNGSTRIADSRDFTDGEVTAISADGSAALWNSNGTWFYWPRAGTTIKIGDAAGNLHSANGFSSDGSTLVISKMVRATPSSPVTKLEVFKWRPSGPTTYLADWFKAEPGTEAVGLVRNTATIFGTDQFRSHKFFAGTGITAFQGIGTPLTKVISMSTNARHFAGTTNNKAVVWLNDSIVPTDLGYLGTDTAAVATGVSDDGRVAVGNSGNRAFYWTAESGLRDLRTVLLGNGMDVRKWTLNTAKALSPNGEWIVGEGVDRNGKARSYLARIKRQ